MTISWGIVADLGVVFKLSKCIPHNIILHVLCFMFVIAMTLYEVIRMNNMYNFVQRYHTLETKPKAHLTIALMMVTLMGLAVLMGLISFVFQMVTHINPRVLKFFRRCHKIIGYALMLLGKAQVIFGWVLYDQMFALVVVASEIGMVLTFFTVFCFKGNSIAQDLRAY